MKRKQSPCKPGPVPLAGCLSFIYSAGYPTALAFYPPSWLAPRTDSPQPMVYANLQPPDGTARRSPAGWWSLTPPSHPYRPRGAAVIFFCLHLLLPIASIFGSEVSYAARTFLSHLKRCQRRAGALPYILQK